MKHVIVATDTSFLLSLLGTDGNTGAAQKLMESLSCALTMTAFNDLELLNASAMAEFQGFKEKGFAVLIESALETEGQAGRFLHPPFSLAKTTARAIALTRRHKLSQGHRTYDVLLVAAALELRATLFLTFDKRQAALARAEGLEVRGVAQPTPPSPER